MRERELKLINAADATIIVSEFEAKLLRDFAPNARVYTIPLPRRTPPAGEADFADRRDIMFVGGFRHKPNVDAILWFADRVWPGLLAKGYSGRLLLVGSHMPPEVEQLRERPGVSVLGFVRDLEPLFQRCRLTVAPLRYGAGIKGKVISSLSYGVPVVATTIAVEGMGIVHREHALVADEPSDFAAQILELYEDPELWSSLSRSGLALFQERFSIQSVSRLLTKLLVDVGSLVRSV
jgi:glycosyltransferase involved in cell wall biosynthesis